jgi:predicted Zn-dependent protease
MSARYLLLIFALWLAVTGRRSETAAQDVQPKQPPWVDPQAMFQQFFGGDEQFDEALLEKIEVSARDEQRIGQQAVEAYVEMLRRQGVQVVQRGREAAYLQQLVNRIQPLMRQRERYPKLHVYYAASDHCNARSFPGGHVIFFRGLLDASENEAALIGMVGHELSHLDRGHHTRRIKEMRLTERAFRPQGVQSWQDFMAIGGSALRVWLQPFRQEYELEADLDGARWAYQAGYDCRELALLFLRLHQQGQDGRLPLPEFLQSHPASLDRHAAIMQMYQQLQAAKPVAELVIGADNLRRRIAWQP